MATSASIFAAKSALDYKADRLEKKAVKKRTAEAELRRIKAWKAGMGPGRSSFDIHSLSNAQIELTMVTQDKPRPGERGQPNEKVLPEAPVNEHPPEEDCKHKKLMRLLRLDRKRHSIAVLEDGVDFGAVFGSPVEGPSMTMDGSILVEDGKEQLTALPQMPGWENGKAMQKTNDTLATREITRTRTSVTEDKSGTKQQPKKLTKLRKQK
jgi:hypothetical protein